MSKANSSQLVEMDRIEWILDPARVEAEEREFHKDPDAYIQRRFRELADWDFEVWARINVKLTTKGAALVPLRFNRVQKHIYRLILEDLAAGRPVRMMIVKARQMGVSTFLLAFFMWLTSLKANRNAIVISQDMESVHNFSSRFRSMLEEGHELLTPPTKTERRDQVHFANPTSRGSTQKQRKGAGLDSRIFFIPCKRPGIGRSYTLQYVHCSETAFWSDMKPKVSIKEKMGALAHAVPSEPGTCVFHETTPNGLNEASEVWREATKGENGYRAVFLSYASFDEYRLPLRQDETLELCGAEMIGGVEQKYGDEVRESRILREEIKKWYPIEYERWGNEWLELEVLARLNWRRNHIDVNCGGDKKVFRREFPLTPEDGFSATSKNCFDLASLELMKRAVEEEGIQPTRFDYIHDPENEDPNSKFIKSAYGPLTVYKTPQEGQQYIISGDPSLGVPNGDPSALVVLAVPDLEEVASFNAIIPAEEFGEMSFYLGRLYNIPLIGIENNERGGAIANNRLHKDLHYSRLLYQRDFYDKKTPARPGFVTTARNKSALVSDLSTCIRNHEILVRSAHAIEQLRHYMDLGDGKLGGAPGFHDDMVSALMIGVYLSSRVHEFPPRVEPPGKGTAAYAFKRHAESRKPGLFR